MRIISQDGTLDVPYEMVAIQRYEEKIYFLSKNLVGVDGVTEDIALAEYSTEARAKEVMERLQEAYIQGDKYFWFLQDSEAEVSE